SLAIPQSYMNLSGESVYELLSYYKIGTEDLIVVYDDYDLNKGNVRIRANGSAGTHNGMRNIVKMLGTEEFKRVRVGFHSDNPDIELINYVLSGIPADDKPVINEALERASDALVAFAEGKDFEFIVRTFGGEKKSQT
ncbi:MAG: aminoacyl-tRNA hydrolase, partial [Clostridia bacterium]|nr:aminoacyl-tRNA hydrolase [Clostridia bacterium]